MFSFETSLESKTADQVGDEITRINERLFKTNPQSPMYNQLLSMRSTAEQMYSEKLMLQHSKNVKDETIEIGYAESSETELEMKEDELLIAVVQSYLIEPKARK